MTFVIAEAGSTHDGDFNKVLQLVETAKACGADAAKFQFWSDAKKLAKRRNAADYLEIYKRYRMPHGWLEPLAKNCEKNDIEFLCTTYYSEDIAIVAPLVSHFKVASFEALDEKFIADHFKYKKTVIVSTGMCDMNNITWMMALSHRIIPLHCVSSYPAPMDQMNLLSMQHLGNNGGRYGLSDHSTETVTGALAVALGASVIEKHLRLGDTKTDNPDFVVSLHPARFKEYVNNIRLAEKAMGSGIKEAQPCEREMKRYQVKP